MKCIKLAMLCGLLTLGMTATAFAAKGDKEVDFTLGFATALYGNYDVCWGFDIGGGYEFLDNLPLVSAATPCSCEGTLATTRGRPVSSAWTWMPAGCR